MDYCIALLFYKTTGQGHEVVQKSDSNCTTRDSCRSLVDLDKL